MYDLTHKQTKSRNKPPNPSFSSSFLDDIYRSMDVADEKTREFSLWEDKDSRKQSGGGGGDGGRARGSSVVGDEGIATLRRAFLAQKWMDVKLNAKNFTHRRRASSLPDSGQNPTIDDDPFWSSGSVSRWSHKPSCFGPFRRKQIKAHVFVKKHQQMEDDYGSDDNRTKRVHHGALMNSNTKRVKQPISPGGRLTSFLNSLFTNGHLIKKPKALKNVKIERISKSAHESTCSSASSFTRSCLSKNSPRTREKLNGGIRRTVRFYPVSVIIDEDCRPCGEKIIFGEQDFMKVHVTTMSDDKFDDEEEDNEYNDDDDDVDDMASDASSDLFELDHLSILKECDELPVYETTHFGTNRAIAKGLIC